MINIRYHIVSITAVFLALGIGVALGSTFLDGATVDVLNKNISSAETRIRASNDKIGALEDDLDAARQRDAGLILLGTDRLLGEQLTDQPVLVVAEPGVGDDQLAALLSVLDRSGADLRGTLALRDRLTLTDGDDALAEAIGLESDASAAELRSAVNAQLVDALAAAGAPAPEEGDTEGEATTTTDATTTTEATTTTTSADQSGDDASATPDGTQPTIVTALIDHDYVDLVPGPDHGDGDPVLEVPGYRYVFVGSATPRPSDTDVLLQLLPGSGSTTIPAVVAAPAPSIDDRSSDASPTVVARVRSSDDLAVRYSTIDDLDTFAGLAATVFTVADLGTAPVGHYGQADGATALLPAP